MNLDGDKRNQPEQLFECRWNALARTLFHNGCAIFPFGMLLGIYPEKKQVSECPSSYMFPDDKHSDRKIIRNSRAK